MLARLTSQVNGEALWLDRWILCCVRIASVSIPPGPEPCIEVLFPEVVTVGDDAVVVDEVTDEVFKPAVPTGKIDDEKNSRAGGPLVADTLGLNL